MRHLRALQPTFLQGFQACLYLILIAGLLLRPLIAAQFVIGIVIDRQRIEIVDIFDDHIALGSLNDTHSVADPQHGSIQYRHLAVLIDQSNAVLLIQSRLRIGTMGIHAQYIMSEHHAGKIQGINTHIQKGASRQLRVNKPLHPADIIAQVCGQHHRIADHTAVQSFLNGLVHRHVADPHSLCDKYIFLLCQAEKFLCLGRIYGKGLFAQHRLSVGNTKLCIGVMLRVGRSDIDQIHLAILQKLLVGAVRFLKSVLFCKIHCLIKTPGCHSIGSYP